MKFGLTIYLGLFVMHICNGQPGSASSFIAFNIIKDREAITIDNISLNYERQKTILKTDDSLFFNPVERIIKPNIFTQVDSSFIATDTGFIIYSFLIGSAMPKVTAVSGIDTMSIYFNHNFSYYNIVISGIYFRPGTYFIDFPCTPFYIKKDYILSIVLIKEPDLSFLK